MGTPRQVAVVLGSAQAVLSAIVIFAEPRELCGAGVYRARVRRRRGGDDRRARCTMAPERGDATVRSTEAAEVGAPKDDRERGELFDRLALAGLVVLGLGAGISPLFSAYYDPGAWVPIGLALVVVAAAGTLAQPLQLSRPMALALAGLSGLGLWSLLSSSWGHAVEQATVDANEWLSYAALLLLLLVLLRRRIHTTALLGAVGLGIAIVAFSVVVRLLGSDPATMFISGRLNSPLGYINGEGCVFAIGCWFGVALAERREPLLAGAGAGMTVVFAGLTLLSQSRGAAIATAAAVLVSLVVVPGARRRLLALAVVAVGVAVSASSLANIYSTTLVGGPFASVVHSAVGTLILAAAGVTIAWGVLVAIAARLDHRGPSTARALQRAATVAAILVVVLPLGVALTRASRIEHTLRTQWHAFVHVADTPTTSTPAATSTRLFSGGGNRYDYWRVAWDVFTAHPVADIGAGGYTEPYFRQRHTTEAIQNPRPRSSCRCSRSWGLSVRASWRCSSSASRSASNGYVRRRERHGAPAVCWSRRRAPSSCGSLTQAATGCTCCRGSPRLRSRQSQFSARAPAPPSPSAVRSPRRHAGQEAMCCWGWRSWRSCSRLPGQACCAAGSRDTISTTPARTPSRSRGGGVGRESLAETRLGQYRFVLRQGGRPRAVRPRGRRSRCASRRRAGRTRQLCHLDAARRSCRARW